MWPEAQVCIDKNKHEIRVTGKKLAQRLEDSSSGGALPEELCSQLQLLTFAEFSGCTLLATLPPSISQLSNLHELLVGNNGLTALPDTIGSLPLLRTLIAEGNGIQQLPDSLFNAPKLHTLNVSRNRLTAVPDSIVNAKELHVLNISQNSIAALPSVLAKLPKLSALVASHNSIVKVPAGLHKLSMLTDLQLSSCSLTAVPQELAAVPKLKNLMLDPNPFDDKKLSKVLKEGRLKNILTHIKKHGTPPTAEEAAAAAEAVAKLQLAKSPVHPYQLLPVNKGAPYDVHIHPEVKGVRQHLVCAVLQDVALTPELYDKFIALQTSIHDTICNKREAAAIGTHDLQKVQLPLQYEALPPQDISFVPLNRDQDAAATATAGTPGTDAGMQPASTVGNGFKPGQEVSADQLPKYFAGDKTMLRYLSFIQEKPSKGAPLYAVLRDRSGAVLSLSPVINAEFCRISPATRDILVEVSSPECLELAQKAADSLLDQFAEAYAAAAAPTSPGADYHIQQLKVAPVRLLTHGTGHVRLIFPK